MAVERDIPETRQIVRVPDLSWRELLASAVRKFGRARVHPHLFKEDLSQGERGRAYEAVSWKPGCVIHGSRAHSRLKELGFEGNPTVFVAWAVSSISSTARDRFVTIPDRERFVRFSYKDDLALCLLRGYHACGWGCRLTLSRVFKPMNTFWTFVAFREVEASRPG